MWFPHSRHGSPVGGVSTRSLRPGPLRFHPAGARDRGPDPADRRAPMPALHDILRQTSIVPPYAELSSIFWAKGRSAAVSAADAGQRDAGATGQGRGAIPGTPAGLMN